jgi:hypothetical protein
MSKWLKYTGAVPLIYAFTVVIVHWPKHGHGAPWPEACLFALAATPLIAAYIWWSERPPREVREEQAAQRRH